MIANTHLERFAVRSVPILASLLLMACPVCAYASVENSSAANVTESTSASGAAREVYAYEEGRAAEAALEASSEGDVVEPAKASSASFRMRMQTYGSRVYAVSGSPTNIPGPAGQFEAVRISLTGELAKDYDVWYRVHAPEIGWLAWAKNGELAGSSGLVWQFADLQMIVLPKGTNVSQDVTDVQSVTKSAYMVLPGTSSRGRMEASGWQDWDLEGEVSGVIGETRCLEALKLKLVGDISSTYNVWYRSQVEGYGWLGWARNGQSSGVLGRTNRLEAIEIRIMSKEAAALGSTAHAYLALISGDAELDSILDAIIYAETSERPRTLREAFDYVTTLPYVDGATEYYGNWRNWSIPLAKQMYNRPGGNCYGYGALMAWLARALGYDARAVSGEIRSGVLAWSFHGWCEIMKNGKPYVLDPDLQKYVPDRNFFMVSYEDAPTYYTEYVSASK